MCMTVVTDWVKVTEDMRVWKVVREVYGKYWSRWSPGLRQLQDGCETLGRDVEYVVGELVVAMPPGLYVYSSWGEVKECVRWANTELVALTCVIPQGTLVRFGEKGVVATRALRVEGR